MSVDGIDIPETVRIVIHKMAWKMARQNRYVLGDLPSAQQDIFQAGCEGYWRYRDSEFFPLRSIKYYMLNELSNICWESRWYGKRTKKRFPSMSLDEVAESRLPRVDIGDEVDRGLNYSRLFEAAMNSDTQRVTAGQKTKHVRTLRLFAAHGISGKGSKNSLPSSISRDTYWYACKSLKEFAEKVLD